MRGAQRRRRAALKGPAAVRGPSAALAAAVLLGPVTPARPSAEPEGSAREVRLVMGSPAEVAVAGAPDPAAALGAAFAALQRVDDEMTLWRASPLTRLNDQGGGSVSAELAEVLAHALEVGRESAGAFDPTVEPLVRAAGALGDPALPAHAARARRRVGLDKVVLDSAAREVRLLGGARLDLGGIAKGFAADRALQALQLAGARAGLVDLGGSSLAVFGQPIVVAIADPAGRGRPAWGSFRLEGAALGTSGRSERGAHIVDPRNGRPATGVLAATVVAAAGMEADALSTALFVLGPEHGLSLLRRRGAAGFVLSRDGPRRVLTATAGFAQRYALEVEAGVEVRERP